MILKSDGFSDIIFTFNCAKHNITRRKPNITAQQYNLPKANITEKRHPKMSFFMVRLIGIEHPKGTSSLRSRRLRSNPLWSSASHVVVRPIYHTNKKRPCGPFFIGTLDRNRTYDNPASEAGALSTELQAHVFGTRIWASLILNFI